MVQLVMIFCLLNSPNYCEEQRPTADAPLSLMGCAVHGQQMAQEWLADHPKWMLQRWRCEAGVPAHRDT